MNSATTLAALVASVAMVVAHLGVWVLAAALQRRMGKCRPALALTGAGLWHALLVSAIVQTAGLFGGIGGGMFLAAGLIAGAAGVALGGWTAGRESFAWIRSTAREIFREDRGLALFTLQILALVALRHAANAWWFPTYTNDETAYHLPRLVSWIQTGWLSHPQLADPRGDFPGGMQTLQAWWVAFLHHDVVIEGATCEMAALGAAACAALARGCGASRGAALLAAALWLTAPAVLVHSTSAMNDIAAAAFILAAFAWASEKEVSPGLRVAACVAALAFGASIKPTVLFAAPGIALVLAIRLRAKVPLPSSRLLPAAIVVLAMTLGLVPYVGNWIRYGNPFHPIRISASGTSTDLYPLPSAIQGGPSLSRWAKNTGEILGPRLFHIDRQLTPPCGDATGWGWTLALVGLPAAVWALWKRPAWRLPAGGFALAFATTLLLVEHDPYNARFVLWFPAVLAGMAAAGATAIPRASLVAGVMLAGSAFSLYQTAIPPVFRPPELLRPALAMPWRERDTLHLTVIIYRIEGVYVERRAEREFLLNRDPLYVMTAGGPSAALAGGDYGRRLVFGRPGNIAVAMHAAGTSALYVDNAGRELERSVMEAVARGELIPVSPHGYRLAKRVWR